MTSPGWKATVPLPAHLRLAWHESEPSPREIPTAEFYADLAFPAPRDGVPYLVANMVMTQNGEAAVDGKAAVIGTRVDGLALTRLRVATDAVLTGVGTVTAEDVTAVLPDTEAARRIASGRPARLLVAVLASRLSWAPEVLSRRLFTDPRFDRIIVTGDRGPDAPEVLRRVEAQGIELIRVRTAVDGRPAPAAVLQALGARAIRSVVTEGGPRVLASLFRARLVHEYFLTTAPFVIGGADAPHPLSADVQGPVLLSRISRIEHAFTDPQTGAALVEAFDRFRVVYPEASFPAGANP
ncbi:MAG TPA: dihydrofolate reductase family protein [bacterium]|nr:dihydrofolate reductase family protein [bacterium]